MILRRSPSESTGRATLFESFLTTNWPPTQSRLLESPLASAEEGTSLSGSACRLCCSTSCSLRSTTHSAGYVAFVTNFLLIS